MPQLHHFELTGFLKSAQRHEPWHMCVKFLAHLPPSLAHLTLHVAHVPDPLWLRIVEACRALPKLTSLAVNFRPPLHTQSTRARLQAETQCRELKTRVTVRFDCREVLRCEDCENVGASGS